MKNKPTLFSFIYLFYRKPNTIWWLLYNTDNIYLFGTIIKYLHILEQTFVWPQAAFSKTRQLIVKVDSTPQRGKDSEQREQYQYTLVHTPRASYHISIKTKRDKKQKKKKAKERQILWKISGVIKKQADKMKHSLQQTRTHIQRTEKMWHTGF